MDGGQTIPENAIDIAIVTMLDLELKVKNTILQRLDRRFIITRIVGFCFSEIYSSKPLLVEATFDLDNNIFGIYEIDVNVKCQCYTKNLIKISKYTIKMKYPNCQTGQVTTIINIQSEQVNARHAITCFVFQNILTGLHLYLT